jgi:hypothetical protein
MSLILRSVKGSKLTIPEMDGNLIYLSSTLSGSVIQVTGSSIDAPNTSITASAFVGDGSGLTNVTAEWDGSHNGNASITGSLIVTAGVTANLSGTASFATTASNAIAADNAFISTFSGFATSASRAATASYVNPLNQTVQITGSLLVFNSINSQDRYLLDINGAVSVDWGNRLLYDSTGNNSIDWENKLFYVAGDEFISWGGGFGPVETQDDLINLGTENSRWRNGYISRGLYVGSGVFPSTTIIDLTPNSTDIVGSIRFTTGSIAPTNPTSEGTMFVGKAGANYYIFVYIGGQWRKTELFG